MTPTNEQKVLLLHARYFGSCKCMICSKAMDEFVGRVDLFRMGQLANNGLTCPGKIPPLAPYGGHGGTRIGSFKTVTFTFARLEHQRQLEFEARHQHYRELAA